MSMNKATDNEARTGLFINGPQIVALGGGTGLSTLLRGLKLFTSNITAVVTVADDGGSSGMLREDLGILPPGDIRNCILALANVEPDMEKLFQYRFKEGSLRGQNMGNLLIAAMTDMAGGFEKGIRKLSNVLAVKGRVLPVSLEDIHLRAELEDGTVIEGESRIPAVQMQKKCRIRQVSLLPKDCSTLPEVLEALSGAEVIVLGPGSLYTSIIPNLLVKDVADAIRWSTAVKIYVCNIMTQPGETTGYSVEDHLEAIFQHGGDHLVDYVLLNRRKLPEDVIQKYRAEGAEVVELSGKQSRFHVKYLFGDLADINYGLVRHDPKALAQLIMKVAAGKVTQEEVDEGEQQ